MIAFFIFASSLAVGIFFWWVANQMPIIGVSIYHLISWAFLGVSGVVLIANIFFR